MATIQANVATRRNVTDLNQWWNRNQRKVAPYLFIAPFFILFLVFGLYPIIYSFWLSFFKGFGFEDKTFFGLGNYIHLFQDPRYGESVWNTTYFALGSVFVLSPLALLVALAINSRLVRWKAFYRLALFFPVIISQVVVAVIFSRVLDTQYGLLNQLLGWLGIPPVGWLSNTQLVMTAFIIMTIWNFLGSTMLFWMGGLSSINRELYEAASIDGATPWNSFWAITLPLLRPVTLFVVIQALIGSYNLFAAPLLLTNYGGPSDASLTITLYLYVQGFQNLQVGYASAIAYSMTFILLILTTLNLWLFGGFGPQSTNE